MLPSQDFRSDLSKGMPLCLEKAKGERIEQKRESGTFAPEDIRFAIGDEDPKDLMAHFIQSARLAIDPHVPGFSDQFMAPEQIDQLVHDGYVEAHRRYIKSKSPMADHLS